MVVAFELKADFGHFSHPATIYSSLTYPIPPKTTIMGLLASIGGVEGDCLYLNSAKTSKGLFDSIDDESPKSDYLFLSDIKYSVVIKNITAKRSFFFNGVKDALPSIKEYQSIKQRKQFYRELLVNPHYEIYIDFGKIDSQKELIINNIKNHITLFPIYMGINLALANIEFIGEFEAKEIQTSDFIAIDSFIKLDSEFKLNHNRSYSDMRVSNAIEENRIFKDFIDLLIELKGNSIEAKCDYTEVNNRNLIFI